MKIMLGFPWDNLISAETSKEASAETSKEASAETSKEASAETSKTTSAETSKATSAETTEFKIIALEVETTTEASKETMYELEAIESYLSEIHDMKLESNKIGISVTNGIIFMVIALACVVGIIFAGQLLKRRL